MSINIDKNVSPDFSTKGIISTFTDKTYRDTLESELRCKMELAFTSAIVSTHLVMGLSATQVTSLNR